MNKTPPTFFLLELVETILEKNYFCFSNDYYMQIRGVAMGSINAPSVANLFMYILDKERILDPTNNPFFRNIFWYKRFLDDIFMIFSEKLQLENFMVWVNNIHPTIKFTHQYRQEGLAWCGPWG